MKCSKVDCRQYHCIHDVIVIIDNGAWIMFSDYVDDIVIETGLWLLMALQSVLAYFDG